MSQRNALISAALALTTLVGTSAAHAGDVHWSVGINLPAVGTVVSNAPVYQGYPARVRYEPAPVYYQPAPVYYQPAPVYYAPPPVVVHRPVVVYQPAPVYYAQPRVSYARGDWQPRHRHGHGHREHQRHGWDRDGDHRDNDHRDDDRRGGGHDHRR